METLVGWYRFFLISKLTLILLLPFLLMVVLGGYIEGSAVILWSMLCPMAAMLFDKPRRAVGWFVAFVGLVTLSGFLQSYLDISSNLSPGVLIFFFAINILGVAAIIFLMVFYFVALLSG